MMILTNWRSRQLKLAGTGKLLLPLPLLKELEVNAVEDHDYSRTTECNN